MRHPEVLLIPVLMFTDYFLTVLGAIRREGKYSRHYRIEDYELNPVWQKSIAAKRWFNPRHILTTLLLSAFMAAFTQISSSGDPFIRAMLGCIFGVYGMVIGRHFANLLMFARFDRSGDAVSGQITMSHSFVLALSLCQSLGVLVPVALIAAIGRDAYAVGATIGIVLFIGLHLRWLRRARKRRRLDHTASRDGDRVAVEKP